MTSRISDREWRNLSAYLDGQLSSREVARLEKVLRERADLRAALEDLRTTKMILRSQPRMRAPRNFTLSAEALGVMRQTKPARQPAFAFGLFSALASLMLVLVVAGEFLLGGQQMAAMPAANDTQLFEMAAPALPEAEVAQTEVAVELRAAPEEMPAATEVVAAAEESADLSSKALPPGAAAEPGVMEYPAPLAADSQAPVEIQPEQGTAMAQPTPEPMQGAPKETQAVSIASAGQAENQAEAAEALIPTRQPFWNGWRIAQATLLLAALASAGIALYLRRTGI